MCDQGCLMVGLGAGLRAICRSGSTVALVLSSAACASSGIVFNGGRNAALSSFKTTAALPFATASSTRLFSTTGGASSAPKVKELWVLKYDYVPDILTKREPHRAGHIGLLKKAADKGLLLLGGALGEPVDTALLVFSEKGAASSFVDTDPYIKAGLVTGYSIRPWSVVVGSVHSQLVD